MGSSERKAARGASTARRRAATRRPAKPKEPAPPHEEALQITLEHKQRVDGEFVQLQQQKAQIEARMEELRMLAQQCVGREQVLRELRGEAPPLPPVALIEQQAPPSGNGDGPEEAEPEAPGGD